MALRKIMLGLDEELLSEIEAYASKMHLNRTAAISVLCSTALNAQKSLNTLSQFMEAYKAEKAFSTLSEQVSGHRPSDPDGGEV